MSEKHLRCGKPWGLQEWGLVVYLELWKQILRVCQYPLSVFNKKLYSQNKHSSVKTATS